ncbi:SET domain-containing protein [Amylocystis lapponica]|nr:SET domain-containing protein [Amylocystis lapponica]
MRTRCLPVAVCSLPSRQSQPPPVRTNKQFEEHSEKGFHVHPPAEATASEYPHATRIPLRSNPHLPPLPPWSTVPPPAAPPAAPPPCTEHRAREPPEPVFRLADIPGKGKGLLATRPFRRGALLFSEAPLFTQPPAPTNSSILAALAARTRDEQRDFFLLANAHRRAKSVLPALGVFETNALPCGADADAGPAARGLFLAAARLNHSCAPNVAHAWDAPARALRLRALAPVPAGAELCLNYADVLGTRAERRAALGFECRCAVCALEGAAQAESDARRAAVRRLFDEVGRCANEPTLGMRKVAIALRLLREEGLVHYRASFCFDAFQFCVLVSDFAHAKAWARQAWEEACCTTGPDSAAARTFKMHWANPRSHRLAGTLPRMTLSGPE